jgi:hypothetical protein
MHVIYKHMTKSHLKFRSIFGAHVVDYILRIFKIHDFYLLVSWTQSVSNLWLNEIYYKGKGKKEETWLIGKSQLQLR